MKARQDARIWIYVAPNNTQCNATVKMMNRQTLEFTTIEIEQDDQARDYVMAFGYLQAPIVVVERPVPPHLRRPGQPDNYVEHWNSYDPVRIVKLAQDEFGFHRDARGNPVIKRPLAS